MNENSRRAHELCKRTYNELCQIPLDDDGQGAAFDAALVALQALNQLRDSVFWGNDRDRVQRLGGQV